MFENRQKEAGESEFRKLDANGCGQFDGISLKFFLEILEFWRNTASVTQGSVDIFSAKCGHSNWLARIAAAANRFGCCWGVDRPLQVYRMSRPSPPFHVWLSRCKVKCIVGAIDRQMFVQWKTRHVMWLNLFCLLLIETAQTLGRWSSCKQQL